MIPHTMIEPQDDPAFLAILDRLVAALVKRDCPEDAYMIHIDNWFDHKWLRYSGHGKIVLPGVIPYPWILVARKERSQDQLTFPPFTPSRVVAQYYFCRFANGAYEERAPGRLIHRRDRQHSSKTLHHRVANFSSLGLFVWYSSRSASNHRGSLLVYSVQQNAVAAWYAGFCDRRGWRLDQVKGIDRHVVASLSATDLPDVIA